MTVKPWIAFTTTLPDDQVEVAGDIAVFGGRNVAVALGDILTKLDCTVDEPYDAGEHGWEFLLAYKGRHRFWFRVTSFHPAFHLLFQDPGSRQTAARNATAYAELAVRLAAALRDDPRFRHVTWWSLRDGPPEEDEVASAHLNKRTREAPSSPIAAGEEAGRPAWGCLAFALFIALSGALGLFMFFAGITREDPAEAIFVGVFTLGSGLIGLFLAWIRRVET
ncbi:MAG: hypothetical protein ACJ798_17565 [Phenylobacterium sp.]